MNVKVYQTVSDDRISDMLTGAFEGGSGHWCQIQGFRMPKKKPKLSSPFWEGRHTWVPIAKDGMILLGEDENDDGKFLKKHKLTRKKLERGLQIMADKHKRHFADLVQETDDAITADVFLQCAVLGEVVYG